MRDVVDGPPLTIAHAISMESEAIRLETNHRLIRSPQRDCGTVYKRPMGEPSMSRPLLLAASQSKLVAWQPN